ncbi:uncharacterized protein LOC117791909 [Drosophila innubila]|uniref:uncharacterized protein LOC117791909 n=1 Tax=Drosophila innubila TaxID=198719 RepID=UPI00148C4FCE|nr:uncharacterized protein LOC117791909 [Drosophila innubila]
MRLTLAWLSVCLAIYCGGGFANNGQGNVVLSLPPSLISATEAVALRQLQQQQQHGNGNGNSNVDALRDMLHSKESATAAAGKNNLPYNDDMEVEQQPQSTDFNRKALSEAYDLEARQQSAPQEIAQRHGHGHGAGAGTGTGVGLKYATPTPTSKSTSHKYWGRLCQASGNCPREYNRAMLAVRNREAVARLQKQLYEMQEPLGSDYEDTADDSTDMDTDSNEDLPLKNSNNEVFLLLTGEQDLVKFLHWAMQLLYPQQHTDAKLDENAADFYHPGMFIWKKLNFSGHLEPPLIVDEPRYVLVRREKQNSEDSYQLGDELKSQDDPFIPPRGRKHHNAPDLDALLNRYETFVPNRGKRDKVKDLFKYDDLFFPNRGKKHHDMFKLTDPFYPHRGKKLQLRDLYNVDDPFFPNRGKRQLTASMWGKLQRKLESDKTTSNNNNNNSNNNNNNHRENDMDKGDNWPQRMSTHEINSNDQSVKSSMSAEDATNAAEGLSVPLARMQLQLPANRLHSTRSMPAHLLQSLQRLRQLQVKTSFPAERLQRFLADDRQTQLTRGPNVSPGHGSDPGHDIDIDYGQLDM